MFKIKCLLHLTVSICLVCLVLTSCDRKPCYRNNGKKVTRITGTGNLIRFSISFCRMKKELDLQRKAIVMARKACVTSTPIAG